MRRSEQVGPGRNPSGALATKRPLLGVFVVIVLAVGLSACDGDGNAASRSSASFDPDTYWTTCPSDPIFDRSFEFATDRALRSPDAAVRAVASDQTELGAVRIDASGRPADVDVRLGEDTGVFHVGKTSDGWLVTGGEGCAAWPAGEALFGPYEECDEDANDCTMVYVDEK